jgi:hypothetical protein
MSTGGGWDSGTVSNITVGTGATTSYIDNTYYPSTGDFWWYPYPGTAYPFTYPTIQYVPYPAYSCASAGHDFMQAKPPMETVLFCRKCGETKALSKKGKL